MTRDLRFWPYATMVQKMKQLYNQIGLAFSTLWSIQHVLNPCHMNEKSDPERNHYVIRMKN